MPVPACPPAAVPSPSHSITGLLLTGLAPPELAVFDAFEGEEYVKTAVGEHLLLPASEALLDDETIKRFRTRYREQFGANATGALLLAAAFGLRSSRLLRFCDLAMAIGVLISGAYAVSARSTTPHQSGPINSAGVAQARPSRSSSV